MAKWTHITVFDRQYPADKQAEGMAVQQAVAEGHCDQCGFLARCAADVSFVPPVFAWCARRKSEIMAGWTKAAASNSKERRCRRPEEDDHA
ncbi:hypothetical protein [uncultured Dysosmobacter sp.]|uniref:hypothetical protein n=1 Tax=uncultured Dysosmobacter sp. TaxID=2591384 RepID=UPI00263124C4|nr:hypothetical protein [uncultured Dysosmobacter sp.]